MGRFRLERSGMLPDWWVLTDVENYVVVRFEEHRFNETQKVSFLDEDKFRELYPSAAEGARAVAGIMWEMGEYMATHWYGVAMPVGAFEWRVDEADGLWLLHNVSPKFRVKIEEETDNGALADALRSAADFVSKRGKL